jgi:hypothetical protein
MSTKSPEMPEQNEEKEKPAYEVVLTTPDGVSETITAKSKKDLLEQIKDLRETSQER